MQNVYCASFAVLEEQAIMELGLTRQRVCCGRKQFEDIASLLFYFQFIGWMDDL